MFGDFRSQCIAAPCVWKASFSLYESFRVKVSLLAVLNAILLSLGAWQPRVAGGSRRGRRRTTLGLWTAFALRLDSVSVVHCCPSFFLAFQVDVDVYRSLGPKRSAPLGDAPSFFAEGLAKWRELCSAAHWLEAAPALQQLSQSLPQLLHHSSEVLDILLQASCQRAADAAGACRCDAVFLSSDLAWPAFTPTRPPALSSSRISTWRRR